ncbi:MAG: O-antigen ligase family protein [Planctomycetota bacterium]
MRSPASVATLIAIAASWYPAIMVNDGLSLSITLVAWLLAAAVAFASILSNRGGEPRFPRDVRKSYWLLLLLLALMSGWAAASSQWSEEPHRVFRVIGACTIIASAIIAIPYGCQSVWHGHQIMLACVLMGAFNAAFLTICVLAHQSHLLSWIENVPNLFGRFMGGFKHPNQAGIALSATFPLTIAVALEKHFFSIVWRRFAIVSTILMLFGLIATGSKANILLSGITLITLAVVASLSQGTWIRRLKLMSAFVGSIVLVTTLFAIALQSFSPGAFRNLTTISRGDIDQVRTVQNRRFIWYESVLIGRRQPWRGTGAGSRFTVRGLKKNFSHSHNYFVDTFRATGIPGLIISLSLIIAVVLIARKVVSGTTQSSLEYARLMRWAIVLSVANYVLSNMSSDSVGPSTSAFLGIATGICLIALTDPYVYLQSTTSTHKNSAQC